MIHAESPRLRDWRALLILVLAVLLLVGAGGGLAAGLESYHREYRGVATTAPAFPTNVAQLSPFGINIDLTGRTPTEVEASLDLITEAGFHWVRQPFAWRDAEPSAGAYNWADFDRLADAYRRRGLAVVAMLDRPPTWARLDSDQANSPPRLQSEFGDFVAAFASHFRGRIDHYQIWNEPNIYPNWGQHSPDPAGYARLLAESHRRAAESNPSAVVLTAALAQTAEDNPINMTDILYLKRMYGSGARGSFDVLGAAPLGMWSGVEDRRVDANVLNFSRVVALREVMVAEHDEDLPVWATAFGWVSLPADWRGAPSRWGQTTPEAQAEQTAAAWRRASDEWTWMGPMFLQGFLPWVAADDPQYGFSVVDRQLRPRQVLYGTRDLTAANPQLLVPRKDLPSPVRLGHLLLVMAWITLGLMALRWGVLAGGRLLGSVPEAGEQDGGWSGRGPTLLTLQRAWSLASEWLRQVGVFGVALAALAASFVSGDNLVLVLALVALTSVFCLRLQCGLALTLFLLPFHLLPFQLVSTEFRPVLSPVELTTLACLAALAVRRALRIGAREQPAFRIGLFEIGAGLFLLLGVLSLLIASHSSESLRELRTVLVEPVAFYFILVLSQRREGLGMLVNALILGAVAIALVGLWQYLFTADVITAEGVRRVKGFYGSPNNLGLYLGRVIPLAICLGLATRWRWAYRLSLAALLPAFVLTFSFGGWVGVGASLVVVGAVLGRRALMVVLGAGGVALAGLIPALSLERMASHLSLSGTTTALRFDIWRAALDMIRDHPLLGIGLDNFLRLYPRYMLPSAWREPNLSHPHNLVLDAWLRLGVGGVVVIVGLLAAFARTAHRLYHRDRDPWRKLLVLGLTASVVDSAVHGMIDNSYFVVDLALLFWFSLAAMRIMERDLSQHADEQVGA